MTRIVTTHYRPKRPPKRKAIALDVAVIAPGEGRAVATEADPWKIFDRDPPVSAAPPVATTKPVIIRTKSRRASVFGDAPDMTPEEHRRRGDASVALWHDLVRRATGGE